MDRSAKYHAKKKEYKNAYKRLKYKLDTKKINKDEFIRSLNKLRKDHNISN